MKKVLFLITGCFLFFHQPLIGQSYFSLKGGIPHLPVFASTASVSSPIKGMMVYSTADVKPMVYNGTVWADICGITMTSTIENYFVIKNGIPCIPAKSTISGTPTQGAIYYSTTDNALMVYNGTDWEKLKKIGTNSFSTNTGSFSTDNALKVAQVPVLASAPSGITAGAIYINSATKSFNYYTSSGWASMSCPAECGDDIIVEHISGTVSPATVTIAYKTVSSTLSGSSKCWITQNLGAASQATTVSDNSSTTRGWFWNFNNMQGHMNTGTNGSGVNVPAFSNYTFNEAQDWLSANDPCTLLLGTGWRIPTNSEWTYVDGTGGSWTTATSAYNSVLKLHMAGYINYEMYGTGTGLTGSGSDGRYFSSTRASNTNAYYLGITSSASAISNSLKYLGYTIRCLKD